MLGTQNGIFWNTGDEHTEEGHITEDPYNRINMMDKRMNKLDIALEEISNEDKAITYGNNEDQDVISVLKLGVYQGIYFRCIESAEQGRREDKIYPTSLAAPLSG